jgi:ubiquinone/menaquinone biosynthesis C-methylase UbiE
MQISRVSRSKKNAQKAYDRLSRAYDWLAGTSEAQFTKSGLEMLAPSPGEILLEIGPGTGTALLEMCQQVGDKGYVHGVDLSGGMLKMARSKLAKAHVLAKAGLLAGDGISLPYRNNSFTGVFMSFTLELFDSPEIPLVLLECRRVLKPGGRLAVVSMLKVEHPGLVDRLYEWMHLHLPSYVDCRPIVASEIIHSTGFTIGNREVRHLWGLPVELVSAIKS